MFLLHHDIQTCLLIQMQMSESHRRFTALGRSVARHCDRGHVTCIRTRVTHRQPVRERQQFQPSRGHAALLLTHLLFFSFHLRCSLPFLSSLAFSPAPPSAVAHAHPRPPSLHTCTLSLRPVHIPQVTGSAESGVIPPLRSCHLPQLLSGMLRVKHGSCTFLFLAISTHAFVCISA